MKKLNAQHHQRILARRLARELTKEELATIAGGNSSSVSTCADIEGGVDGGCDD